MFTRSLPIVIAMLASAELVSGATIFSASGADAASVQPTLDAFRASLGTLNGNLPQVFDGGRREVNWDGVPPGFTAPNPFPGDFFNGNTPGRARGIVFSTPGSGLLVPIAALDDEFAAFSPQRIFEPSGSFITDVTFRSPANQKSVALTTGFGVIFLDVDGAESASLEFFNVENQSLGKYFAPAATGDRTFSFVGVDFDSATIARVRIVSGNSGDAVKMDDFIFGEASPVPEPATGVMFTAAAGALLLLRRRK